MVQMGVLEAIKSTAVHPWSTRAFWLTTTLLYASRWEKLPETTVAVLRRTATPVIYLLP